MAMYYVELYNKTGGCVVESRTVNTEADASATAKHFIRLIKNTRKVVSETNYDISPRGYVIGQTLYTADTEYVISTGVRR